VATLDREVEQALSSRQARYTARRRAVVAALSSAEGPRSAAELHFDLDSVPLSSLYRSLAILEEAGVVVPHLGAKGLTRYELAEWIRGHHHHFICIECGTVEDIDVSPAEENQVRRLVETIGSKTAFTPTGHALEIEGRCALCT
jgi:Fe2+ or Zn2+ uptake regulation protein